MLAEAISIQPQDAAPLRDLGDLLRLGSAQLVGPKGEHASIPAPLYDLLKNIVQNLEDGRAIVLMPEEKELTTRQASEMLGFSRPYVIRLLDEGKLPFRQVDKHRRILLRHVLAFAKQFAAMQRAALDQMARDAYEAGLYDNYITIPEGGSDE